MLYDIIADSLGAQRFGGMSARLLPILLAELVANANTQTEGLHWEITTRNLITAAIVVAVASACLIGIKSFNDWLSEQVPRRFRLPIKQSLPFWKGLILMGTFLYLV